jgi:hypothetical protein
MCLYASEIGIGVGRVHVCENYLDSFGNCMMCQYERLVFDVSNLMSQYPY